MSHSIAEETYGDYQSKLLAGSHTECMAIVDRLLAASVPVRDIYVDLVQRSLYEVGDLWERHRISVATEHMATAITERLLNRVFSRMPRQGRVGRQVVIANLSPELHQVGARIVGDWCEMRGWDSLYLGANVPADELLRFLQEHQPDLLILSLAVDFHLPGFLELLEQVPRAFPRLPILIGGRALQFRGKEVADRFAGVTHVPSIDDLEMHFHRRETTVAS